MLIGRLGWIAISMISFASAAGAAEQCRLSQLAPIPVTMIGWRPTIAAELNGNRTRLLVDTGAFFDVLSPAEAAEFNLPLSPTPHGYYITGGLGTLRPQIATVKDLKLGPLSFHGNAIFLVGANDIGDGIAGVLGQNLYQALDVEFDFAGGMMRLFTATDCRNGFLAYWARGSHQSVSVLDLQERDSWHRHLLGTVQVNGQTVHAIFDTGAPTSWLSLSAAKQLRLSAGSPGVVAVGNTGKVWSAPIDEIRIGDNETIEHTHILVEDYNFAFGPGIWMFIGADFFLSHRVYLATSQSKLYFTYNGGRVFDLDPSHAASQAPPPPASGTPEPELSAGGPPDAGALMRRGVAEADRLQFQQAIADLTQACALAPRDADYRYQRGVVYWRDDEPELARQDFDEAIRLDPHDLQARLWRVETQLVMQAARKPDPTAGSDPSDTLSSVDRPVSKGIGRSTEQRQPSDPKIDDEAKLDLDAVDGIAAPQADVRLTLGRVYEDIGQYVQAIHQYDLWITYHPKDYRLAVAFTWRCGSRARASTDLDQAMKDCNAAYGLMGVSWWSSRPKWTASWIAPLLATRSLIDLRQGNFKRAISDDDAAVKLEPDDAYALYARGLAELRARSMTQGHADLTAAGKLDSGMAQRFANLGLAP